jgi:oligopeptidase B
LNFKLVTSVTKTEKENWNEVIPHWSDVYFENFEIFKDYLVVSERIDGITRLCVLQLKGKEYSIDFEEEVYYAQAGVNLGFDTNKFRFIYTLFTTHVSTFEFNLSKRERNLIKQQEDLGEFD